MTDASYNSESKQTEASLGDYFALLKPRVMSLVIFTAFVGMLAAPVSVHPVVGFASILFIAIGAGASGALNMWWDADIDQVMKRTAKRPIPAGKVQAGEALYLGAALSGMAVMMLALSANLLAGGLLAFTIFFYAVVYTMWLKRSTPQNIVIFIWTPPHFWALALFMRSDYDDAGVPMLTVTHGRPATRRHILAYTVVLFALAVGAGFTSIGGPIYLLAAVILNTLFLKGAYNIWRRDEVIADADDYAVERKFFKLSILYLFLHFGAILAEALLRPWGLGGW
jgi:protoheme IX farnesyltransferase